MLDALGARWRQRWAELQRLYVVDVVARAAHDFNAQGGSTYAAAMSYYALLSLVPLLIAVVAVFGFVLRDPGLQDRVVRAILDQFPAETNLQGQVEAVVSGIAHTQNGILSLIGLVGAVWTASGMFGALRRALNRAFDVPGTRSFIHGKVRDLISVVGVLGLAFLSVASTTTLGLVRARADEHFRGPLPNLAWGCAVLLLPLGLSLVTFLSVYRLIPNQAVRGAPLWTGAVLAALGFELAKGGFSLYVANFGRYQEVYGALGGVVLFLVFVFVVANIVIFAAEVTSELAKDRTLPAAGQG